MSKSIAVIDYGMGNLRSVSKAIEHVAGAHDKIHVTDDPELILQADRVVFPGQGAARDCMAAISKHHLNRAVLKAAETKPFLGICMGMQVLMRFSEENQGTPLMGLFEGQVKHFPESRDAEGHRLKIPQMGWNRVKQTLDHPLWEGIDDDTRFYFVHSYYVDPEDRELVAGTTDYGIPFTSVIARDNLFATQFHPEKSADAGLRLLQNFVNWDI
ncbi:imidazole glycerol phosphate synthase subunit HisH [Sedimenticola selenatireducens]|mgnify:CR=1 FL=1|jgi:glutamine amidotransferase|uniref:Imidazole glycerol phosphate synthase subunit HisH n=1 Tax=Sedimenticola selenatireducens TaxID=191960 RepID=A0A557SLY3_9GAMM|nr:imidazole glycerol phosphate synthase subunit HisH [Sedimenticola selenatireducens]TVO78423.1 imidazole glycerol phosphate synthase subunit HisH [Sedimenticola selenatireducens]TVT62719.1 MAG: imidazole glycerol phosphate synthase subunit HisH [Sedimenticola selenatireducens]